MKTRNFAKKLTVSLLIVLASILTVTALSLSRAAVSAAESFDLAIEYLVNGAVITEPAEGTLNLRLTSDSLKADSEYLVMMVSGNKKSYSTTPESVLYVSQSAAVAQDSETAVEFDIIPRERTSGIILLSGIIYGVAQQIPIAEVQTIAATENIPGDANSDGVVSSTDLLRLHLYIAERVELSSAELLAADLNGDESVTTADFTALLELILAN